MQLESGENNNLEERDGDGVSNPAKSWGVHTYLQKPTLPILDYLN